VKSCIFSIITLFASLQLKAQMPCCASTRDSKQACAHFAPQVQSISNIFRTYTSGAESTDSPSNKEEMLKGIESIEKLTDSASLRLILNVWLYYDPTDFDIRNPIEALLKRSGNNAIEAVNSRLLFREMWENPESYPYAELHSLLDKLVAHNND
jgi:hypothetical protein